MLKPAVRGETAWKKADESLPPVSNGPRVPGLHHSKASTATVPPTRSTTVTTSVSFVCRLQRLGSLGERQSSSQTGKPMPPAMMASATVTQIHPSVANGVRLSVQRAKPALLNAVMEWKTPR